MKWSWWAFWVTIAFYLAQAMLSYKEGTFSLRQLDAREVKYTHLAWRSWQHLPMSFLNNWSVSIGDLMVFPIVNSLVMLYLWPMTGWWWKYPLCLFFSIVATWVIHKAWWRHDENLGHVFADWRKSGGQDKKWMKDITAAGRAHYWFLVFQVAVMLAYIFTPMPLMIVFYISLLLIGFVLLQQTQAVFVQNGAASRAMMTAIAEVTVIVIVAAIKLV